MGPDKLHGWIIERDIIAMPSSAENFLTSAVEFALAAQAAGMAKKTDKYFKSQIFICNAQAGAAAHYKAAANIQAAKNAVFAGCVALCTMYVGGLVMQFFFRGATAGAVALEGGAVAAESAGAVGVGMGEAGVLQTLSSAAAQRLGYTGIGYAASGLTFAETVAIEAVVGVPIRGGIAVMGTMVTNWYSGKSHWTDILKIEPLAFGGALRTGPALGFLLGYFTAPANKKLREEFEQAIKSKATQQLIRTTVDGYAASIDKKLKGFGKYGNMILVPPHVLDSKIRQLMQRQVDTITDQFVREQTGMFGGPERGEVYSSVYASLGSAVWAPIATDTSRAYIHLQKQRDQKLNAMNLAFNKWSGTLAPRFR